MPTSTIWRRRAAGEPRRGVSPERPTAAAIESLSPERDVAPTFSAARPPYVPEQTSDTTRLEGLGLSQTVSLPKYEHPHQELEINRHGVARLQTRNIGHPEPSDHQQFSPQTYARRQTSQSHAGRSNKGRTHTRSGSTIDDLASAAIAHSPTLPNGSPRPLAFNGSPSSRIPPRPSTSHISPTQFHDSYEHPAKRIKSDRLPAMEWAAQPSRPTTSYESTEQSKPDEEAVFLLLGLKEEVNFSKQITPRATFASLHRPEQSPRPYNSHRKSETHQPPVQQYSYDAMEVDLDVQQPSPDTSAQRAEQIGEPPQIVVATNAPQHRAYHATEPQQSPEPSPSALTVKKPRRLKPEMLMAEVCAECGKSEQRVVDTDDATIEWIQCNGCSKWFHTLCAGIRSKAEARTVDKFICRGCEPEHGSTTYVRTSSRARTAIDYAGLNQGVIKSSVETSLHHYIQPLKTGKYAIKADDFARIRPELLTMDFMQSFDGMKRPFVVPAAWNPRFGEPREAEIPEAGQFSETTVIDAEGNMLGPDAEPSNDLENDIVVDCDQDLLDMVMPRDLTVRKVANIVGPEHSLGVIDVKSQETKGAWTVSKWADYYENSIDQPIRNVISLEVSESPLGRILRRPKVVRDLDLEDRVWPMERYPDKKKKSVQFYCLMSVADSYTDFHIDFGGSAVYYHILKGTKVFFFIPPEDKYLKKYEQWCNSSDQNETWLPDLCDGNVTRVDLKPGDTAFIPAGWIHSVWTPEDSLVIGGNYLTPIDYELQIRVATIEKDTGVGASFRYPFFQKVMWYTLINYLQEDPVPEEVLQDFRSDQDYIYLRANPVWAEIGDLRVDAEPGTPEYNFRLYPKSEIRGLPALRDYLYRTARVAADLPVENITKKAIEAVKRSVPKEHGDPLDLIKTFAIWCAWKAGNETAPSWLYSDDLDLPEGEKKPKKAKPDRIPGERTSSRRAAQAQSQEQAQEEEVQNREAPFPSVVTPYKPGEAAPGMSSEARPKQKPVSAKPTPLRMACDACRKRRVKCRHRLDPAPSEPQGGQSRSPSPLGTIAFADGPVLPPREGSVQQADEGQWANASLAQSALAAFDNYGTEQSSALTNGLTPPSGKKSRSKACDECRKSKRRCVHDEYGRIDPAKAAEPTKPRGSTSSKRPARPSDGDMQIKRSRLDSSASTKQPADLNAMIDPLLLADSVNTSLPSGSSTDLTNVQAASAAPNFMNGNAMQVDPAPDKPSTSGSMEVKQDPEKMQSPSLAHHPTIELSAGIVVPEHAVEDEPGPKGGVTPHASTSPVSQRHSSRQPKQVERFVPEDHRSPSKDHPTSARRASSAVSGHTIINSVKSRRSSSNTSATLMNGINNTAKKAGPTNGVPHPDSHGRESTAESELDADEKLARELQQEVHGLRRRPSMRA